MNKLSNFLSVALLLTLFSPEIWSFPSISKKDFEGVVVDEKGEPIENAKVTLYGIARGRCGDWFWLQEPYRHTFTSKAGKFIFTSIPNARYWVEAQKGDRLGVISKLEHPNSMDIILSCKPAYRVAVNAIDQWQNSVKDYTIKWYVTDKKINDFKSLSYYSYSSIAEIKGEIGEVKVANHNTSWLVPQKKFIHIKIRNKRFNEFIKCNIELKNNINLGIKLSAFHAIQMLVLDKASQLPLSGARIALREVGEFKKAISTTRSNENGEGTLYVQNAKEYSVDVSSSSEFVGIERRVLVEEQISQMKNFELEKGQSLKIKLIGIRNENNKPQILLKGVSVSVQATGKNIPAHQKGAVSDENGILTIKGLKYGEKISLKVEQDVFYPLFHSHFQSIEKSVQFTNNKELLELNVEMTEQWYFSKLYHAVLHNKLEKASFLLSQKVDPNLKYGSDKRTLLHENGISTDMMNILKNFGAEK